MKRLLILLMVTMALFTVGCTVDLPTPKVYDTGIDPDSWARVPAGEFLMGQFDKRTVVDYDYEIMVTPVTNAQYAKYLNEALAAGSVRINAANEVVGPYPGDKFHAEKHEIEILAGDYLHVPLNDADLTGLRLIYAGNTFTVETGYENHPVTVVTWFGARAYCEFYGGRLPTETEWEKAARGTEGIPYPWGHELLRANANYYFSEDPFEADAGKVGVTNPVGFYNGKTYDGYQTLDSPSPYGLYDMAGNVWEWTANVYEGTHNRYMRGGSKAETERRLRVWSRDNARPEHSSPNVGFRSARSVSN
jgi:formylglycine-generating enzyme required for sulfatase activity